MRRRKRIMLFLACLMCVTAVVFSIATLKIHVRKGVATQIAEKYLFDAYEQEMLFSSVRFSWSDPSLYRVTFSPINNPSMFFQVIVQQDLAILESKEENGIRKSPDNYLSSLFSFHFETKLQYYIDSIWDGDVSVSVEVNTVGTYAFNTPAQINEHLTPEEMEPYFKYSLFINAKRLLDTNNRVEEAKSIMKMISAVRAESIEPEAIFIFYYSESKNKSLLSGNNKMSRSYINFVNWAGISNLNEILEVVDEQWFKE